MADEKQTPKPAFAPSHTVSKSAADVAAKGEKTVQMVSPRAFRLQLDNFHKVQIHQGLNEVPESLVEHPYLKDNGVKVYEAPKPKVAPKAPEKKGDEKGDDDKGGGKK